MVSRFLLALFFVAAGINHFVWPAIYLSIMPRFLPWPAMLVAVSGAAEILGGVGVVWKLSRVFAGWGLIALLIAVFPANIQAISTGMIIAGHVIPEWLLWARLPLQIALIWWTYRTCCQRRNEERSNQA